MKHRIYSTCTWVNKTSLHGTRRNSQVCTRICTPWPSRDKSANWFALLFGGFNPKNTRELGIIYTGWSFKVSTCNAWYLDLKITCQRWLQITAESSSTCLQPRTDNRMTGSSIFTICCAVSHMGFVWKWQVKWENDNKPTINQYQHQFSWLNPPFFEGKWWEPTIFWGVPHS